MYELTILMFSYGVPIGQVTAETLFETKAECLAVADVLVSAAVRASLVFGRQLTALTSCSLAGVPL